MEGVELALRWRPFSGRRARRLFTAAYEGYFVPSPLTRTPLRFLTRAYDLDRGASRVAIRGGDPIGLGISGCAAPMRGSAGSASSPPIDDRARPRLDGAVHDEARVRGVERVWLE